MRDKKPKFIVVAGSIMSGLGKGIVSASIAKLLTSRGFNVLPIKFDGYLNVDCGTMNPFRHGEVFVLDDGTEVDMDFGTYERFLNKSLPMECSITGGKLFQKIIEKERKGEFLGRDVQFVPHLTDEIKTWVRGVATKNSADIIMVEIGGTIGDLENSYFVEAMRQMHFEDPKNVIFIQLTYVPSLGEGEQKTKPTQQATKLLQSLGIQPNIIITREQEPLSADAKKKISLYCNISEDSVFDDPLLNTVYELPLVFEKQGLYQQIAKLLDLENSIKPKLENWSKLVSHIIHPHGKPLKVAIVGKYTAIKDAYVSVKEALVHAAASLNTALDISWIESTDIEKVFDPSEILSPYHAILVPGGFGERGIEGKIKAIKYARENKIPYLGLCLGLQLMVIEYARNVSNLEKANSTEFDKNTKHPIVDFLPEQLKITKMGATMRLGAYDCKITKGTIAESSYKSNIASERHRHRYEVNPSYVKALKDSGLVISATHDKNEIVEMVEWKESFGIATQAHIELKSRLEAPSPIFVEFLKAAINRTHKNSETIIEIK